MEQTQTQQQAQQQQQQMMQQQMAQQQMMQQQNQQQQNQQQAQQQAVVPQPPTVITTKDCAYLKDQLSWELLAMKKCRHFAAECSDKEIGQLIDKAGQMHERHYQLLLKHLQTNNQAGLASFQAAQTQH